MIEDLLYSSCKEVDFLFTISASNAFDEQNEILKKKIDDERM